MRSAHGGFPTDAPRVGHEHQMACGNDAQPPSRASLDQVTSSQSRRHVGAQGRDQESSYPDPVDRQASLVRMPKRARRNGTVRIQPQSVPVRTLELDPHRSDTMAGPPEQSFDVHMHGGSFLELAGRVATNSVLGPDGLAACQCGSTWWRLEAGENGEPGAIVLAPDLSVTGWSGTPVCVHCDRPIETSPSV